MKIKQVQASEAKTKFRRDFQNWSIDWKRKNKASKNTPHKERVFISKSDMLEAYKSTQI
jgi:hypothetical protein